MINYIKYHSLIVLNGRLLISLTSLFLTYIWKNICTEKYSLFQNKIKIIS